MNEDPIELDEVLGLCRSLHRRIVLAVLVEEQRPLTVHDLVKTILKHNHRTPITEGTDETVRRIHLSLSHVHIPKLEGAGVIKYDPERQLVEPGEVFDQLRPYVSEIIALDSHLDGPVTL